MRKYLEIADKLNGETATLNGIGYMLNEIAENITTAADEGEGTKLAGYVAIITNEVQRVAETLSEIAGIVLADGRENAADRLIRETIKRRGEHGDADGSYRGELLIRTDGRG